MGYGVSIGGLERSLFEKLYIYTFTSRVFDLVGSPSFLHFLFPSIHSRRATFGVRVGTSLFFCCCCWPCQVGPRDRWLGFLQDTPFAFFFCVSREKEKDGFEVFEFTGSRYGLLGRIKICIISPCDLAHWGTVSSPW